MPWNINQIFSIIVIAFPHVSLNFRAVLLAVTAVVFMSRNWHFQQRPCPIYTVVF